jgi:hypothetical protein
MGVTPWTVVLLWMVVVPAGRRGAWAPDLVKYTSRPPEYSILVVSVERNLYRAVHNVEVGVDAVAMSYAAPQLDLVSTAHSREVCHDQISCALPDQSRKLKTGEVQLQVISV